MQKQQKQVVGIVGAGLSGLIACKYMLSKGFKSIVFEAQNSIGRVWTKTLETTKLQTPKPFYQFSDFPWPESVSETFPDHYQVLDYIRSYAHHFDLIKHIRFNTKVISATFTEESQTGGHWNITIQNNAQTQEVHEVGFLILCLGRFSGVPNIPESLPGRGPKVFEGNIMHSMDYAAMDYDTSQAMIRGKRVAIVGIQKSAMDIAMECSTANGVDHPCTVIYRSENWSIPDYEPWGVPIALLYLSRFSELLVHKPGDSLFLSLLATLLSPVRWGFSKFVESYIKWKLKLAKFGMVPEHSFLQELSSCLTATVPQHFYDRVEKGSIRLKKAPSFGFCKEGILIDGDNSGVLETDVVILATGFRGVDKLKNIFKSPTFQNYITGSPDKPLPLYRQCIHPRIPRMAIVGFSESISNLYTSEMRCRWVAELLDGTFKLPTIKEMEKDIAEWEKYMKRYAGKYYRRSCVGALHIHYNDQLYKDMGLNPKRKKGLVAELFEPYGPMDYASP